MNKEAQRIAIAEACGELKTPANKPTVDELEAILNDPTPRVVTLLPNGEVRAFHDYLNDLNAMHEAEKVLPDDNSICGLTVYINKLTKICGTVRATTCATAAQRAEAFLRTLGLWKDE